MSRRVTVRANKEFPGITAAKMLPNQTYEIPDDHVPFFKKKYGNDCLEVLPAGAPLPTETAAAEPPKTTRKRVKKSDGESG